MRPSQIFLILAASLMVLCNYSCKEDPVECPTCITCDDGIQNGDETGIDCGGSCQPCENFCNDGIQNGDETDIDCGGSCCPCPVEIGWSNFTDWENPRTHMATVLLGNKLYISGGADALINGNLIGTLEVFDFSTGAWETLAEMNVPRVWHSMDVIGDTLYVMGGVPGGGDALKSIERYIIGGEDKWEMVGYMHEGRAGFLSCVLDGKIYAIGGWSGYYPGNYALSSVRVYDPKHGWTPLAAQPQLPATPLSFGGAEVVNGKICIAVGFEPSISAQDLVLEYDPDRPELGWVTKDALSAQSGVGATCVLDDRMFYLGGFGGAPLVWPYVDAYSQQKGCVFGATEMPKGRGGHASCVYQGDLYVFGGVEASAVGSPAVSTVWRGVLQP